MQLDVEDWGRIKWASDWSDSSPDFRVFGQDLSAAVEGSF